MKDDIVGPYIVWEDYGCEGWKPTSYPTTKAALVDSPRYSRFILTKALVFEVVEEAEWPKTTRESSESQ